MKKLFLSISILFSLFLFSVIFPSKSYAQKEVDCWRAYEQEDYKCFKPFNECSNSCLDSANARTRLNVNGSKLYSECIKASDCEGKSKACHEQASTDYRACLRSGKQPTAAEVKKETPAPTETAARLTNLPDFKEWPDPRDISFDYLVREAAQFDASATGYWEIKPEDFVITAGAPKPEGGNIWIVEPRAKVWVKAKGQNEYKPFDSNTTLEHGSYIKTETPVDFWVKGVGLVQLRPGSSGSGMLTVEEINGKISPFLLLGEMEIKYGKPIEEETQKPKVRRLQLQF